MPNARANRAAVEVAQLWGDSLVALAHFDPSETVTLGETPDCSFFVPAATLPRPAYPLLVHRAGVPFVRLTRELRGYVERGGGASSRGEQQAESSRSAERLPLAAWLARGAGEDAPGEVEIPLAPGERVRVELAAGLVLLVQRVERAAPVPSRGLDALDLRFLGVFASLTIGVVGLGVLVRLLALLGVFALPPAGGDDLSRTADVLARFEVAGPTPTPPPSRRRVAKRDPDAGTPDAGAGAKLRGDEGKIGRRDAVHEQTTGGARKTKTDRDIVRSHGVLGALQEMGRELPAIFGGGELSGGMNDNLGALQGPTYADQEGTGGFALRGPGDGGGGESLTIPGFAPSGRVPGGYDGSGDRPGKRGTKPDAQIDLGTEEVVVTVGLDPALIEAVITRHLDQLQFCYERRLIVRPELDGKLVVRFTIGGDGFVTGAAADPASTLLDEDVAKCVVQRFRKFRFPAPPGRGVVGVRYPLLFKTAGR